MLMIWCFSKTKIQHTTASSITNSTAKKVWLKDGGKRSEWSKNYKPDESEKLKHTKLEEVKLLR